MNPPPPIIVTPSDNVTNINWDLMLIILVIVSVMIIIIQLCSERIRKTKCYRKMRTFIKLTYQRLYSIYKIIGMFLSSIHTACIQRYNLGFSLTSQLDEEDYQFDDFDYHTNHLEIHHSRHRNDYLEDDDDDTLSEIMLTPSSSPPVTYIKKKNSLSILSLKKSFDVSLHDDGL